MRRPVRRAAWRACVAVAAVLAVACAASIATGCASSGTLPAIAAASPTASTIKIRVLPVKEWGFKMAYPDGWVGMHYTNPKPGEADDTLQFLIAYADPHGVQGNGSYLDSVQVAVYRLSTSRQPSDLTQQMAVQIAQRVMLKDMSSFSLRALKKVDVGGVPGWSVGYQYSVGGQIVDANSMLILKGHRAYWMTSQSGAYDWQKVATTLDTCQRYFELL